MSRVLHKEYQPWMAEALSKHLKDGYSFGSFTGRYWIDVKLWIQWSKAVPELREINKQYKHYLKTKRSKTMKVTFDIVIPDEINITADQLAELKKSVYGYAKHLIDELKGKVSE